MGFQDLLDHRDQPDHQDHQGRQEGKDPKARQEDRDLKAQQEGKVLKARQEDRDLKAQQGLATHKVEMKVQEDRGIVKRHPIHLSGETMEVLDHQLAQL